MSDSKPRTIIIGAGFTGLAAARDLARAGHDVTVLEKDSNVGGLAGGFDVGSNNLEKFYHHWFLTDKHIMDIVAELGAEDQIVKRPSRTGSYYANSLFRLSRPLDLLRYKPLSLIGRFRLGFLVLQAAAVSNWRPLEDKTASEWLRGLCGEEVYEKVWRPLLRAKFGACADEISAVWMWNKLALRGGSRNASGDEVLAYYKGGFAALGDAMADDLRALGANVRLNAEVGALVSENGHVSGVQIGEETIPADNVLIATPAPIASRLLRPHIPAAEYEQLNAVRYLGNVCLVLSLDRALSDTYWINVIDPTFPFVGIIEHTNFEAPESYGGKHIVYLSRYCPVEDPLYAMDLDALLAHATPFIQRMFPAFSRDWIVGAHVWKEPYAQPIVTKRYSKLIPPFAASLKGVFMSNMAQIYPEDRGTNYACREGRLAAARIAGAK